jgi:hypothetical protein
MSGQKISAVSQTSALGGHGICAEGSFLGLECRAKGSEDSSMTGFQEIRRGPGECRMFQNCPEVKGH